MKNINPYWIIFWLCLIVVVFFAITILQTVRLNQHEKALREQVELDRTILETFKKHSEMDCRLFHDLKFIYEEWMDESYELPEPCQNTLFEFNKELIKEEK